MNIMSNENSDQQPPKKKSLWTDFVSGIQDGFKKMQQGFEDQIKRNQEKWEEGTQKAAEFVKKMKDNWDTQVNQWKEDFEKAQQQNQENWNNVGNKLKEDYEKWENKVREDWKDGVKEFNKASARAYLRFLLYTIPIIIVLVIIFSLIGPYLPTP